MVINLGFTLAKTDIQPRHRGRDDFDLLEFRTLPIGVPTPLKHIRCQPFNVFQRYNGVLLFPGLWHWHLAEDFFNVTGLP